MPVRCNGPSLAPPRPVGVVGSIVAPANTDTAVFSAAIGPMIDSVVLSSCDEGDLAMKSRKNLEELFYQMLETELGGVEVYKAAIACAVEKDLRTEWQKYLTQTERHVEIVRALLETAGLDPKASTPGRLLLRQHAELLVSLMGKAKANDKDAAQIFAAECVVLAETKDHMNWSLLSIAAKPLTGELKTAVDAAIAEVEDQEDEHLYHTQGWARELWVRSLGLAAVLPPPEERKKVTTAVGAARAKASRDSMR